MTETAKERVIEGRSRYELQREFSIDRLYTFHYYELSKSFYSTGEKHDFWEMLYVDKGALELFLDGCRIELTQGDLIFYEPNAFHSGGAKTATNVMIVTFDAFAPCMSQLGNRLFRLEKDELYILTELLKEGFEAFDPPIDRLFYPQLGKSKQAPFGCEHMIIAYLELFLIKLLRRVNAVAPAGVLKALMTAGENQKGKLIEDIVGYMKRNVAANLTLDEISEQFFISKTQLKVLFKQAMGIGIMHYFSLLKIDEAKEAIREESYNYTEIAQKLGYSSVHYFSKCFKRATGMTPTEYAKTVQSNIRRKQPSGSRKLSDFSERGEHM
ncbi:helix-turn-helix domain-containing protein [Paenibacillus sp. GCM10012303]|uniref:AraC family transcriptional regulator n=1 Tax=Paenibacillus sp. GCM10012303 TaxID=3317340 RepID=UPI0036119D44